MNLANGKTLGQVLLTTCVGSVEELEEMVSMIGPVLRKTWQSVGASANATSSASLNTGGSIRSNSQASGIFGMKPNLLWNTESLRTLYHFVRCSQLEYVGQDGRLPIQVLLRTFVGPMILDMSKLFWADPNFLTSMIYPLDKRNTKY